MRLRWWRPKAVEICPWCPLKVERRIADVENGPPQYGFAFDPADRVDQRPAIVAEMRRIVATEFPPPCHDCPRATAPRTASAPTMSA